jgi:hypothetical protein
MCGTCLEKHRKKEKVRGQRYREQCIVAYGEKCVCCGKAVKKYLQLDHIENDGAEHRQKVFGGRHGNMYRWAVKNDFPDCLQLMCADCHQAKTYFGGCTEEDHELMREYHAEIP